MVTPTNHVIAGPDLHCAGPQALWVFLQYLSAKYREVNALRSGANFGGDHWAMAPLFGTPG